MTRGSLIKFALFAIVCICFIRASSAMASSNNGIQVFPPTAPDLNTSCPAGQVRILGWDGSTQVQCIPNPPTCAAGSTLSFTTTTSPSGVVTGTFSCRAILSTAPGSVGWFGGLDAVPINSSNPGCDAPDNTPTCPRNWMAIGEEICANNGDVIQKMALYCQQLN